MHKCPIIFSKPEKVQVLRSDPKASIIKQKQSVTEKLIAYQTKLEKLIRAKVEKPAPTLNFLNTRPYRCNTAFGYTTLIDTRKKLKSTVFLKDSMKMRDKGLDKGELKVMDYLVDGSFYSHTG